MHPLSIILVKSDSKGDRLLFRYPFVQLKEDNETNKLDKKKNPYSISLLEEQKDNNNQLRQLSIDPAATNIQLESDEVLSSLFACKLELANQKFELKINDIRFVSHPALMENKNSNSFILINIVFALQAQCSYSIVKCYYELSKRLGLGLLYEERRANYLTKEMKTMLKVHEDTIYDHKSERIFDTILQKSSLAQCLKQLYFDLCTSGLINVVLNESVTLCFCLPQKAWMARFSERKTKTPFIDPDVIDRAIISLKPYHGFLLLVDPSELLDCVPPSGAKVLLQLIESYNPLKSLQSMSNDSDLSLDQVFQMVGHLVYWAKATIIYPLCETNVYVISPDAPIHVNSPLVEKFANKFPGMSLIEVISDFSLPTSIGHLTTPLQHPARQGRLAQMVLWMLQHHLLMQLHTYVQFMPSYEKPNDTSGLSLSDFGTSPKQSINTMSPEKSPMSDPLDVPNSTSNARQIPSSSQKSICSNFSVDDNDDSMNSLDDDEKIKELLNSFDECDRQAILKVPASSNFEDLNLMVRLKQSGYFQGEHHLEEIMFYENLRRSQLLQLLDKFRDVLILYETEDAASCLGFK
ncbi:hypothetical protein PVAND_009801 [Polypedilum vanderplanki]|uniref:GATOR complex protein NPRL3 n=1 Tax=Polypedilum vanderplanki TaxID=319348 RepID=A0A9J6CES5_POLVA|nr:hypothetical protein PVAND_009801 [Polypedilum vanderplanki]